MRVPQKQLVSLAALAMAFSVANVSSAQSEKVQATEVLLLLDTSGSMSYAGMRDSVTGLAKPPACSTNSLQPTVVNINATTFDTVVPATFTPPDRWSAIVSALTGSVTGHRCWAQDRASADFLTEYKLHSPNPVAALNPYDAGYYLPFNRIVAYNGTDYCTPAPSWNTNIRDSLYGSPYTWPTDGSQSPVLWRKITSGSFVANDTYVTPCSFEPQATDGAIDQYEGVVRFGLMTFDTNPVWNNAGVLSTGTGLDLLSNTANFASGIGGTWSYFPSWQLNDSSAANGNPGNCTNGATLFEVGSRNPIAPPWEGRLLSFGDPYAQYTEIVRNNQRVQQSILGMRPFGGTPVAGMLEDAKYFLFSDKDLSKKPEYFGAGKDSGGFYDPWVTDDPNALGCRRRFALLITDGGPNLDMKPYCALGTGGKCPYGTETPADKARYLRDHNVPVFVVGYSVTTDSGTGVNQTCTSLLTGVNACNTTNISPCDSSCPSNKCAYGYCIKNPTDELRATCCTISGIATQGWPLDDTNTPKAYFAESPSALKVAIGEILSKINGKEASETVPVFASGTSTVSGSGSSVAQSRFFASFQPTPGDLTLGKLKRTRYLCQGTLKPAPASTPDSSDDYQARLDGDLKNRTIMTAVGATDSSKSIRALYATTIPDDGISSQLAYSFPPTYAITASASGFLAALPANGMIADGTCETSGSYCCFPTGSGRPSRSECEQRFLTMELATGTPAGVSFKRSSGFGAIEHSTPVVMTSPGANIPDSTYGYFQQVMATRPPTLFTATIDGQLHAFDISNNTSSLNEMWSFIPPAILPLLPSQFPNQYKATAQNLLDGPVIVQDVAGMAKSNIDRFFLSRTPGQANDPSLTRWYTILIGSLGASGGYYALDVTWPDPSKLAPTGSGYTSGPRFLWQLTTDAGGIPIFGDKALGTPTITTLYFTAPGQSAPAEHAVAILPGGAGGVVSSTQSETDPNCSSSTYDDYDETKPSFTGSVKYRCSWRQYTPKDSNTASVRALGGARSVTVVLLSTGEIIRTFRRSSTAKDQAPTGLYHNNKVTVVPFRAPIVGQVVAFPSGPGSISDRAYVGDNDGFLWRFDFTSIDPASWSGGLFFDAFPQTNNFASGKLKNYTWSSGQPIETRPILSIDSLGRTTINFSTGDQRELSSTGDNFVWSLTENRKAGVPIAKINWFLGQGNWNSVTNNNNVSVTNAFTNGHRVTGPMVLFNGKLYFTTYQQSASSNSAMCGVGESYLWGVDYTNAGTLQNGQSSGNPADGPAPGWTNVSVPDYNTGAPVSGGPSANYSRLASDLGNFLAYGPGLTQVPTCFKETTVSDPYFGSYTSSTTAATGNFQLIIQTGKTLTTGIPETVTKNLVPPVAGVTVSSWASIVE